MTDTWWRVTLHHRDSGTYPRIIVSAACEDDAMTQACNIELAPRRSVVSVEPYNIGKDDRMNKHECVTWEFVDCDEHHEHDDDCRNLRVCVECGA